MPTWRPRLALHPAERADAGVGGRPRCLATAFQSSGMVGTMGFHPRTMVLPLHWGAVALVGGEVVAALVPPRDALGSNSHRGTICPLGPVCCSAHTSTSGLGSTSLPWVLHCWPRGNWPHAQCSPLGVPSRGTQRGKTSDNVGRGMDGKRARQIHYLPLRLAPAPACQDGGVPVLVAAPLAPGP